ncbi:MAG: hypothetical protein BWX45_00675 [Deltaproteobacteria bacterium ADurb.Bin002]|nr:MAG: hypothetical protein BWX45_00675 [Deltaproteobacteria bacterium ADurb.Bin002]
MLQIATTPQITRYQKESFCAAGRKSDMVAAMAAPRINTRTTAGVRRPMVFPTKKTEARMSPKKYDQMKTG